MFIQLAWKNVWRNKKRSLIILLAISFGLWAGIFSGGIMMGMAESMVNSAVDRYLGHIEIHNPEYRQDPQIFHYIKDINEVEKILEETKGIKDWSKRILIEGMAASATSTFGVQIIGVEKNSEKKVTRLNHHLVDGIYLASKRRNEILIGKKLSERLNLETGKKIILTFQDESGELIYLACRISGIYKTESSVFDETHVFLNQVDLLRAINQPIPKFHQIAIRCTSAEQVKATEEILKSKLADLDVADWEELAPELAFISSSVEAFTYLFVAIIIFALLFGITNAMLMSVVERIRELGILTAIGMKRLRIFSMILVETILLSISGGIIGMMLGGVTIYYYNGAGIDLSAFAEGLESFGSATTLFPFLPAEMYIGLTVMILIAANIASILPAVKAVKLVPAEAIRTNY